MGNIRADYWSFAAPSYMQWRVALSHKLMSALLKQGHHRTRRSSASPLQLGLTNSTKFLGWFDPAVFELLRVYYSHLSALRCYLHL